MLREGVRGLISQENLGAKTQPVLGLAVGDRLDIAVVTFELSNRMLLLDSKPFIPALSGARLLSQTYHFSLRVALLSLLFEAPLEAGPAT